MRHFLTPPTTTPKGWKRKSHDILPAYLEQVPYDPYKQTTDKATGPALVEESKAAH